MSIIINDTGYKSIKDVQSGSKVRGDSDKSIKTVSNKSSDAHGTYHMANNPHLYEPERSNNFEFVVFFNQDLIRAGLTVDGDAADYSETWATGKEYAAQEVLRMSVASSSVPHFSQNKIQIKRGNTTINYAGVPEFGEGKITVYDYIGADTKSILMAWQNLSYNVSTERVGLASDYKKSAYLIEYSPDLQKVRTWELYGCWVSGLDEDEYSSDTNDKHKMNVTIVYDKAKLVVE